MAVVTGTYDTHTPVIGMREDLSDVIYNISPTETPFMMMVGRGTATATTHEWQIDALATEDFNNAQVEGDEAAFAVPTTSIRVSNFTQISRKTVIISGTTEQVDKAGRKSELAYQLAKMAKELKRDMEATLIASRATAGAVLRMKSIGAAATPAYLGPCELWFTTGDTTAVQPQNRTGTAPTETNFYEPTATEVLGTTRAFKEADLKEVIREAWTWGGDPSVIMVGPFNKQALSAFSGNTTRFDRSEDMRLVTAVDVYVSDFGEHRVVPNRFQRDRSALVLTPRMWSVDYLRGFRQFALAKTGDAEKRELLAEYTLRASNPHASGVVADLTTS